MSKETVVKNIENTPEYRQVNCLIEKISESKPSKIFESILNLGDFLVDNPNISIKQSEKLHKILVNKKVLKYNHQWDTYRDYCSIHEKEVNYSKLNFSKSSIEGSVFLQADTILNFSRLMKSSSDNQRMNELISVFNDSHIRFFERIRPADTNTKISFENTCQEFKNFYSEIFNNRKKICSDLLNLKLIDSLEADNLLNSNETSFLNIAGCDKVLLFPFFDKISKNRDLKRTFFELQNVLQLGCQMACSNYLDGENKN